MSIPRRLRPSPAWAHTTGAITLTGGVRGIDTRTDLAERLYRYCWSYDERRVELLEDCFTADAVWRGNVMGETVVGPLVGRVNVLKWLTGFWEHQRDQRRHVITNLIIERYDDDSATCLAYLLLLGSKRAAVALESAGIYRVDLRREADGWRICHLDAAFDVPFWKQEVQDMEPWVRDLFGITHHESATPESLP